MKIRKDECHSKLRHFQQISPKKKRKYEKENSIAENNTTKPTKKKEHSENVDVCRTVGRIESLD